MRSLSAIKQRKGQMQTLAPAIIAILMAGFFLVMGIIILETTRDTDVVTQVNTGTVTNESLATTMNETGVALARKALDPAAGTFSVSICGFNNASQIIDAANYTVDATAGTVTYAGVDAGIWNNTLWNCSYTYLYGDEAYTQTNTSITGLATFGDFWEIIVIAIVLSVVMGLILFAFAGSGRR